MADITSQFIFDIYVQRKRKTQKDFGNPSLLTQIKINCPPDYPIAKTFADFICDQIIKDIRILPRDDDEDLKLYSKLGLFAYESINTFEQNKVRFNEP